MLVFLALPLPTAGLLPMLLFMQGGRDSLQLHPWRWRLHGLVFVLQLLEPLRYLLSGKRQATGQRHIPGALSIPKLLETLVYQSRFGRK